ncbi:MAG: putative peptidoglycan lipid flippase [Actinomycetota bacterium]
MTAPAVRAEPGLFRSAATISLWNTVSRVTGFVRVLAVGAALGTTFVGNTYQSSNLVSNLLFELLAAGLLSAPLVPAFVALIDRGERDEAVRLAGSLLGVCLAGLGAVVIAGMAAAPALMRLLTVAVDDPVLRHQEIHLGTFLLWFFLPQVLLYAGLAVATALLNADRSFAAPAVAPVANNVVVTLTMVAFVAMRAGEDVRLSLPNEQRLLLAVGTTAGVLAMAAIPISSARRRGLSLRPRWNPRDPRLLEIGRVGLWGGVLLAAVQVMIGVTLVLANQVRGGVVAYQIAFTFFLLPVALVAHPVFTALYPRMAAAAHAARWEDFGADVGDGIRRTAFFVLPATAALVVVGGPALRLVQLGALDRAGAHLVGRVLAAYAIGLTGYSCFLLLARAWTAAGDARLPAIVAIGVALVGAVLMVVGSRAADGSDRVVALGLAHSAAMTGGAFVLSVLLERRHRLHLHVGATLVRSLVTAAAACGAGALAAGAVDTGGRAGAAAALAVGLLVVSAVSIGGQFALRAPELHAPLRALRSGTPSEGKP